MAPRRLAVALLVITGCSEGNETVATGPDGSVSAADSGVEASAGLGTSSGGAVASGGGPGGSGGAGGVGSGAGGRGAAVSVESGASEPLDSGWTTCAAPECVACGCERAACAGNTDCATILDCVLSTGCTTFNCPESLSECTFLIDDLGGYFGVAATQAGELLGCLQDVGCGCISLAGDQECIPAASEVICGGVSCGEGQYCCGLGAPQCIADGTDCPSLAKHCDGPEDCRTGQLCCGIPSGISTPGYDVLECSGSGTSCNEICHVVGEDTCTRGSCTQSGYLPTGYGVCLADAGG